MRKLIFILTLIIAAKTIGQDAAFSQYYASALYLNPAMAGVEEGIALSTNYRTQWRSVSIPYVTNQISLIYPFFKSELTDSHKGSAGLSVYNDRAGDGNFKTLGVNLNLAYDLWLDDRSVNVIMFGLQGGVIQKRIDYTNLQWGEQYNPFIGFDVNQVPTEANFGDGSFYPDFGAGFIYYYNPHRDYGKVSGYFGTAVYHINEPNESFVENVESNLPRLYKVHGGAEYELSEKATLSPNLLLMFQNEKQHTNLGMYFGYQVFQSTNEALATTQLTAGVWHRIGDAFIGSIGLVNDAYSIGFSYDYNSSSLRYNTRGRGAYEVSLTLRKITTTKNKKFATPRI